jgi:AcrR family transcriptional regulator
VTDTRDRILDTAEAFVTASGFSKLTMEQLAREAGLSRATIYLHFKNKSEIALECADRLHSRLLAHLRQIAGLDGPVVGRLRGVLIGRVLFAVDAARRQSAGTDRMLAGIRPAYMVHREQYFANEAKVVLQLLQEGVRRGEFFVSEPSLTALALVLSTNSLMPFNLSTRQLKARHQIEQRVSKIVDLVLSGLCAAPRKTGKIHNGGRGRR